MQKMGRHWKIPAGLHQFRSEVHDPSKMLLLKFQKLL
jgi:hypothetical protein